MSVVCLCDFFLFHEKLDDPYRNISENLSTECKGQKKNRG